MFSLSSNHVSLSFAIWGNSATAHMCLLAGLACNSFWGALPAAVKTRDALTGFHYLLDSSISLISLYELFYLEAV